MPNQSKNVLDFYVRAFSNKNNIVLHIAERDLSVAECAVLSCLDAIARDDQYPVSEANWDLNKELRMIILSTLDGKFDNLKKKDEYQSLVDEFKERKTLESKRAEISIYFGGYAMPEENPVISEFNRKNRTLRTTIRQGHIYWGAKGDRLESILEHIYGTLIIMLGIESEYGYCLDYNKIFKTLILHETNEIKDGDETEWDVSPEVKKAKEKAAVREILKDFNKASEYIELLDNFIDVKGLEAEYGHLSDKAEYDLTVRMYDLEGRYDFENRPDNVVTRSERVRKIIDNGANTVFDVHYEYDKNRYYNIPCLRRILEDSRNL
jgi:hypothetical protein